MPDTTNPRKRKFVNAPEEVGIEDKGEWTEFYNLWIETWPKPQYPGKDYNISPEKYQRLKPSWDVIYDSWIYKNYIDMKTKPALLYPDFSIDSDNIPLPPMQPTYGITGNYHEDLRREIFKGRPANNTMKAARWLNEGWTKFLKRDWKTVVYPHWLNLLSSILVGHSNPPPNRSEEVVSREPGEPWGKNGWAHTPLPISWIDHSLPFEYYGQAPNTDHYFQKDEWFSKPKGFPKLEILLRRGIAEKYTNWLTRPKWGGSQEMDYPGATLLNMMQRYKAMDLRNKTQDWIWGKGDENEYKTMSIPWLAGDSKIFTEYMDRHETTRDMLFFFAAHDDQWRGSFTSAWKVVTQLTLLDELIEQFETQWQTSDVVTGFGIWRGSIRERNTRFKLFGVDTPTPSTNLAMIHPSILQRVLPSLKGSHDIINLWDKSYGPMWGSDKIRLHVKLLDQVGENPIKIIAQMLQSMGDLEKTFDIEADGAFHMPLFVTQKFRVENDVIEINPDRGFLEFSGIHMYSPYEAKITYVTYLIRLMIEQAKDWVVAEEKGGVLQTTGHTVMSIIGSTDEQVRQDNIYTTGDVSLKQSKLENQYSDTLTKTWFEVWKNAYKGAFNFSSNSLGWTSNILSPPSSNRVKEWPNTFEDSTIEDKETRMMLFIIKYPIKRPMDSGAIDRFAESVRSFSGFHTQFQYALEAQWQVYLKWCELNLLAEDLKDYILPGRPIQKELEATLWPGRQSPNNPNGKPIMLYNVYPDMGVLDPELTVMQEAWATIWGFGLYRWLFGSNYAKLMNGILEGAWTIIMDVLKLVIKLGKEVIDLGVGALSDIISGLFKNYPGLMTGATVVGVGVLSYAIYDREAKRPRYQ
jgi:hypothetical protein